MASFREHSGQELVDWEVLMAITLSLMEMGFGEVGVTDAVEQNFDLGGYKEIEWQQR